LLILSRRPCIPFRSNLNPHKDSLAVPVLGNVKQDILPKGNVTHAAPSFLSFTFVLKIEINTPHHSLPPHTAPPAFMIAAALICPGVSE
jgi:hypothetical protein